MSVGNALYIVLSRQPHCVNMPSINGSSFDRQAITFNPMRNKARLLYFAFVCLYRQQGSCAVGRRIQRLSTVAIKPTHRRDILKQSSFPFTIEYPFGSHRARRPGALCAKPKLLRSNRIREIYNNTRVGSCMSSKSVTTILTLLGGLTDISYTRGLS
jgi:hypothetical protein